MSDTRSLPRLRTRAPLASVAIAVVSVLAIGGSATTAVAAPAAAAMTDAVDYTSYVDPFVSTAGDNGNDLPGAQMPNGLVKVNPLTVTGRSHTGYDYNEDQIAGFTQTNLDGVGGSGAGGDILVVPTENTYTARPGTNTYAHDYAHDDEDATPGYYRVGLSSDSGGIDAEATATTRTSLQRFTFADAAAPSLVIDMDNNFTSRTASSIEVTTLEDGRAAFSGEFTGSFNGATYQMAYYAETQQAVVGVQTWGDDGALTDATSQDGTDTGAVVSFATGAGEIELRVSVSTISAEQAQIDQQNEVAGLSFDDVRAQAHDTWNERLSSVDVSTSTTSDPDGELTQLFYTHLYRMFALPMNATSTSGTYQGVDGAVHAIDGFTYYDGWSSWDDFRKYSVFAYVDPDMYRDMVQSLISLLADAQVAGADDLFDVTHSVPTVRFERSAVIIADALSKGYTGFDRLDEAYPMLEDLTGYYTGEQLRQGYVSDQPGVSVQRGYDQWALAIVADALGKTDDAEQLREQASLPLETLYKDDAWTADDGTEVGLLTPRTSSGDFSDVDYEQFEAANLYQGTLWQYNWYSAYDMDGIIDAMGGTDATALALEHMFGEDDPDNGEAMLHSNANEIDLQAPYLFNYVGEPSMTQKWVRSIYTDETWNRYIATGSTNEVASASGEFTPPVYRKVYSLDPEGFLPTMDNDAGTMSTMFVAAAIGLFPVTAGSSQYQVGSPFFDSTTITYENGRTFTVDADGVSADDYYIQSATLNGEDFENTWLDYADVVGGGELSFQMGATASDWGTDGEAAYSMSTASDEPAQTNTYALSADSTTIEAAADGTVDGSVTLSLADGASFAAAGTDLVASGAASFSGLPEGVTGTITVRDGATLEVAVTGTVTANTDFTIVLTDDAIADGVGAARIRGVGVSSMSPLRISVAAADRSALQTIVDEAVLVRQGNYSYASYTTFTAALERAQTRLAEPTSTSAQLRTAKEALQATIDTLTLDAGAFRVLEAEQSDDWSGGSLSNEAYYSTGNLGGVTTGSWITYYGLDFAGVEPQSLLVRYSSSYSSTGEPSTLEAHAGDVDAPVIATASLPGRDGWNNYGTISVAVTDPEALMDAEQVTFEFTAPDGQAWVSNFDWFQFSVDAPASDDGDEDAGETLSLTAENVTDTGDGELALNLGGGKFENVTDGAWAEWAAQDLGDGVDSITVTYDKPQSRAASDSHIEVRLGSLSGDPVADIPLEYTGSGWGTYSDTTIEIDPAVFRGTQDVYVVFASSTQSSAQPYVANVQSFTLDYAEQIAPVTVEAESWVANSGNGLKSESSTWNDGTSVTNLGATYDGAWLDYGDIDFGSGVYTSASVHYVNNSSRCGADSAIDLYLDAYDSSAPGTPFATIELPVTGTSWDQAGTTQIELPSSITGTHRVYLALRTTADSSHPYVANIDNLTFAGATGADDDDDTDTGSDEPADTSDLAAAVSETEDLEGDADRYDWIDFGVYQRELAAARTLLASGSTSQQEVDDQARSLRLSASQLIPRVRLVLENQVAAAEAMTDQRYTDDTWTAFQGALADAQALVDDETTSDDALAAGSTALAAALDGLVVKDDTVTSAPAAASAVVTDTAVTVTWAAPGDDGGSTVTGYLVELDDGHAVTIDDPAQRSAVFSWLEVGTRVAARVSALNAIGTSDPTAWTTTMTIGETTPTTAADLSMSTLAVTSTPFDDEDLDADYASDSWPETPTGDDYFVYLLRDFNDLDTDILAPDEDLEGEPTATNDTVAIDINHAASADQVDRAEVDADSSPTRTEADGFGSQLGALYLDALEGGDLPKTEALFGRVSSGLDSTGTAKDTYAYLRPYVRMGLVGDGGEIYESGNSSYDGLSTNGSFPSGHTYSGYISGTLLATLVPELAPQILARASEYGDNRIVLGFHYPLDVMGSRMVAQATIAHRWADEDFEQLLLEAHEEIESVLLADCQDAGYGDTLTECAGNMYDGLDATAAVDVYTDRMTYGFAQVGEAGQDVEIPADAAGLLATSFPNLTDDQRLQILEQTAIDSGYALDVTDEGDASWQRVNLAKAMTAQIEVASDGTVTVLNYGDDTGASVSNASAITVGGVAIDGFDPETQTYVVDWPESYDLPAIGAIAAEDGATVSVDTAAGLSASTPLEALLSPFAAMAAAIAPATTQTVTVTSANGEHTTRYTVALALTAQNHLPSAVDPGDPADGSDGGATPTPTPGDGAGSDSGSGSGADSGPGADGADAESGTLPATGVGTVIPLVVSALLLAALGLWFEQQRRRARPTE